MSAKGTTTWLACAEDGAILDSKPYQLDVPLGLERGQQLVGLRDECIRVLEILYPATVTILDPETVYKTSYKNARSRATGEILLSLVAAQLEIPCSFVTRQKLRSKLGLGSAGKLVDLVAARVPTPLTPHWTDKRDLAALAALMGQEDFDATR